MHSRKKKKKTELETQSPQERFRSEGALAISDSAGEQSLIVNQAMFTSSEEEFVTGPEHWDDKRINEWEDSLYLSPTNVVQAAPQPLLGTIPMQKKKKGGRKNWMRWEELECLRENFSIYFVLSLVARRLQRSLGRFHCTCPKLIPLNTMLISTFNDQRRKDQRAQDVPGRGFPAPRKVYLIIFIHLYAGFW